MAKRDLSISYERLGDIHLKLGAADKALAVYQKRLELAEALAKADPSNADAKHGLSTSYNKLGNAYLELGTSDKALEVYQKDSELAEALAASDPANADAATDLSYSYSRMGNANERANKPDEARRWYEKMLAVDRKLSERVPESAAARRGIAVASQYLGRVCGQGGDWTAAVTYARDALDHARAARQIAGNRQPFSWDFSVTWRDLGDAQAGAGQVKEARQSYEEAVRANPKWSLAHNSLAWLLATCWDDTVRDGKRAVTIATTACELSDWKEAYHLEPLAAAHAESRPVRRGREMAETGDRPGQR